MTVTRDNTTAAAAAAAPHYEVKPFSFAQPTLNEVSDEAVARTIVASIENWVRYDTLTSITYLWNGVYWQPASDPQAKAVTREALVKYRRGCAALFEREHGHEPGMQTARQLAANGDTAAARWLHARKFEKTSEISKMHTLVKSDPRLWADPTQWDSDAYLLGAPNGTINLTTGKLQAPEQTDYITKATGIEYDSAARCPRWEQALDEIFLGDSEVIDYVQTLFGYMALGEIRDPIVPFFTGIAGRNGKDTIAEAVVNALGDYAKVAPEGLLLKSRNERHRAEILEMKGSRLYVHSEMPQGSHLHDGRVKQWSGMSKLAADSKGGREVTFTNATSHLITCNTLPKYDTADTALAARVRVIPFTVHFRHPADALPGDKVADVALKSWLSTDPEAQRAILAWLVAGTVRYLARGHLAEPDTVRIATDAYRAGNQQPGDDSGVIAWLNDNTDRSDRTAKTDIKVLFENYRDFIEMKNGAFTHPVTDVRVFGKALNELAGIGEDDRTTENVMRDGKRTKATLYKGIQLQGISRSVHKTLIGILDANGKNRTGGTR